MSRRAVLFLPEGDLKKAASSILESLNIKVQPCADTLKLGEILSKEKTHLFILSEKTGDKKAEDFIPEALKLDPPPTVIVGLLSHSMQRALELMNAGVWECVPPSFLDSDLENMIKKGIARSESAPVRFPPKKPLWKKRWFAVSAACLVFAAIGGTVVKVQRDKKERVRIERETFQSERQFPLPYSHPSSIAFQGNYFWIADWYAQSIYKHEPDRQGFVMLAVYHLSDLNPLAIAWQDEDLWVLSANHKIQRYAAGQKLKLLQSARTPANNPSGMTYDGRNLWTADAGTKKLYRHLMDKNLTVEAQFDYPGTPAALFCEGTTLWSLDAEQNRLVRHKVTRDKMTADKFVPMERSDLKRVGATFDGERFWTLSEKPPLAIRQAISNE